MLKIKDQQSETEGAKQGMQEAIEQSMKIKYREKDLELKIANMQQQVKTVTEMVNKLKEAMPSQDLRELVNEMQALTKQKFQLDEEYSKQEEQLLGQENQLRVLAKQDTGLS